MRSVTDQQGRTIPWDKFLERLAEAILANVVAFEKADIPLESLKIMIGRDGTSVKAGKAILQTPIESELTDQEGRELFDVFERLHKQVSSGAIPPERIKRICEANKVFEGQLEELVRQLNEAVAA